MPIRIIVTDLDSTLLRNDKTISDYTVSILNRCRENDILVVYATARPVRFTTCFFDYFIPDIFVSHNGAVINCPDITLQNGINFDDGKKIVENLLEFCPDVNMAVEIDEKIYANFNADRYWPDIDYIKSDLTDLQYDVADKLLVSLDNINIDNVKYYLPDNCYVEASRENIAMIMSTAATKINAVKNICDIYNFGLDEVVAFGDDDNDLLMLKNCGIGVAVNNATEKIKSVANHICDDNQSDGVARWLEDNILIIQGSMYSDEQYNKRNI